MFLKTNQSKKGLMPEKMRLTENGTSPIIKSSVPGEAFQRDTLRTSISVHYLPTKTEAGTELFNIINNEVSGV
jgi:hypothetical protein